MTVPQRVAVLLYHNVGPVTDPGFRGLTVSAESFAQQIRALGAMGWNTITPGEWVAYVRGEREIEGRALMITFDDAYAGLPEHEFHVLERHGYTATVFVPTALVGGTIARDPRQPESRLRIMDAAEISAWAARGMSFGAHSHTHADLTTLSRGGIEDELTMSRAEVARLTGRLADSCAYPFGRSNEMVREIAAGLFAAAFTIDEGLNDTTTPLSSLRRTMVQHGDSVAGA